MLRTHLFRSDLRVTSLARSSGATVWTNTKDASPTATMVPMPMLMFNLKGTSSMALTGSMPVRHASRNPAGDLPRTPLKKQSPEVTTGVEELRSEPATAALDAPDLSDATTVARAAPELGELPTEATSELPPSVETEKGESGPSGAHQTGPQPSVAPHQIELIIDSLTRHELIESIPVTVASLGDKVFTATVHALNVVGTGNTLGDALIVVKEQIDLLYEKLSKSTGLDNDEKEYLLYLQSHIKSSASDNIRNSKRSIWR